MSTAADAPDPQRDDSARAHRPDALAWTLLITLGVIWGASFAMTGAAVRDLPPLTVAAGRLAVGALLLLPLSYLFAGGPPPTTGPNARAVWRAAFGAALAANVVPFALLAWAQTHIPAGLAGVYMASLPLVVLPLAAWLVPGEKLTWLRIAGFAIGFCGVVVLIGVGVFTEASLGGWAVLAQIACIGAATGYAVGSIVTKLAPTTHPVAFGAATLTLAAAMSLPPALWVDRPWTIAWTLEGAAAVGFLGAAPTALAMVLLYEVLRRAGPSFLSLVNYQVPIWAMVFGVLLLGETIPAQAPLALALILAGVAISQGAHRALLRRLDGRRHE